MSDDERHNEQIESVSPFLALRLDLERSDDPKRLG